MKMRPPATPIINIDPYFSVWTTDSVMKTPIHWTGHSNSMCGRVFVDGKEYHFFGTEPKSFEQIPKMNIEKTEIDAFSTSVTYKNENISLTVKFTSPLLADDLYYVSRPIAYCKVSYKSVDNACHKVSVKFTVSEELVLNSKGEGRALSYAVNIPDMTAIKMGSGDQKVLWRSGDDVRIDWGYFYLAVNGKGYAENTYFDGMYAVSAETELKDTALFLFGYDDIYSIQYFGENIKAYWKKDGKTIEDALKEAADDYDSLIKRCSAFSDKIKTEATVNGGCKYAELLLLAYRQVMAAHKLVVDGEGNNLYISKECFSNGCAATVDVTYPSSPLYLLYNPELLKAMIRPVMRYAATDEWKFDFAPHDVGTYPLLNGQVYGKKHGGEALFNNSQQMPVEECGNMIILFSAVCEAENDVSFAEKYVDYIDKWSWYLVKYGADPENQICTDDFAGHLAHNVNLSVKAIVGIAAYSRILERMGRNKESADMMKIAKEYAASLTERAGNSDGSYRLAYDRPDTFSLKYNAVWDKIWHLNLFPKEFYKGETDRYKKEMLPYGVPLDSREKYTKSDWLLWAAAMSDNNEDFRLFADLLWSAYNTMRIRAPMTDWYYADTSHMTEDKFCNRTVLGGLFIKLLLKKCEE